ncbi:hypothetical protein [Armatimonas sp.]|uniref:hypothetical protein n=1 Tax=Armatimonas sp. TaxID=1872638 RepID=UPI003751ECEF
MTTTDTTIETPPIYGISKVASARRERIARLSMWRQSLPTIDDAGLMDADTLRAIALTQYRHLAIIDNQTCLVARDGTYQPVDADPYRGLRAIAAEEALGLACTHSIVETNSAMIRVTLIQPSRREAQSIRASVMQKLLATSTDGDFDAVARKQRATKAEKQLAQRVAALRHVGMETQEDKEIRGRVGVTISEIRSV